MNLRPSGYEPDELPGCSTPRRCVGCVPGGAPGVWSSYRAGACCGVTGAWIAARRSLGGDADTMACIAGAVAEPFFGIPDEIREQALARLDEPLEYVVKQFQTTFGSGL